ncbi:structural maintenance of chromosomes protein 6 [Halyomorpha halys]|uniref:structural maintenance of chromosomes protein 6 n=1 Tax=Halyomorpha halys TaxID=286706 RepID=UPI0006D50BF5
MTDIDSESNIPRKKRRIAREVENLLNIILEHDKKNVDESTDHESQLCADDDQDIAGKIKSIKLQNFMCHSNFEFTFEDKVNFISGKNGSGKSAILTALVIGLGGRTADTNRGHSLKNLIQNGKHKATIEITLSNKGFSSFKKNIYGNVIKVVRNITPNSSGYKIISERGEVVSTKRDDIELINLYFNIQVNNPVTILNQDTARTFIKSATPKDLYSIFVKGTHLEEIEQRHLSLKNEKLPFLEEIISKKNNELIEDFKDVKEYKEKLKKMDELHEFELKAKSLQNELYWAYVLKFGKKLEAQKVIEMDCLKQLPLIKEKVEKRDKIENELGEKQRSSELMLNETKEKKRIIENQIIEVEGSLNTLKDQIGKKVSEIKHINKKITSESKSCDEIQVEIDNHKSRHEEVEAKKRNLEAQRLELENRLSELKAIMSTTVVHKQQLSDTVEKASTTVAQKEQYYNNLGQKLRYKEEYLKGLRAEKNQLIVYSKWMPQLVASIERAHQSRQFKQKPLGPIGAFIKVKEESWGPAIESIIGQKVLSSFCVDNNDDFKVLKSIMDRLQIPAKQKPSVSISKYFDKVHDVSNFETGYDKYNNLLRSISVSHPVIANSLIDQLEPETVLLIPTSDEAYRLMEDQSNVPRYCKRAITKKGDLFFPAPNYRSYSGSVAENTKYLQVSPAQAIKLTEAEIHSTKQELLGARNGLEAAKQNFSHSKQQLEESQSEALKLNRQIASCENKLDELRKMDIPESFDVNLLKEDLVYRQNTIKTCEGNLKALEADKENLITKYKEIKQNIEELQRGKEEKLNEIQSLEGEIKEIRNEYCRITVNRDHYKHLLKNEETKLESVRKVLKELEKEYSKAESEAKEAHPESMSETRDIEFLEGELAKLNGIMKSMEKMIGSTEDIPSAYEERLKLFSNSIAELNQIQEVKQKLFSSVNIFMDTYQRIKELVSANTKHSFHRMLQKKNYKGDLIIDHSKKTLSVKIKVDSAAKDGSTTTLSGGERSYSMVSFIMSLWSNMYSPFFFLDEFDVFMDEINRNMILNMLVNYAKSKSDQQFVFLTPHGNLSHDLLKDVHFFRMEDPRRQMVSNG